MDFFARQDKVRRKSRLFFFAFVPALIIAVFFLYLAITFVLIVILGTGEILINTSTNSYNSAILDAAGDCWLETLATFLPVKIYGSPPDIFSLRPIVIMGLGVIGFILMVAFGKQYAILKGGGAYIAKILGGREIIDPKDLAEKQLINIVTEMSLASGLPRPQVYVLPNEPTINAITAGLNHNDAIIAVTQGALNHLNRDELQAVVAHEFAHILNDDYSLNLMMAAWLYGLLLFSIVGGGLLSSVKDMKISGRSQALVVLVIASCGLLLKVAGGMGHMLGALIDAAFCRSREHLADAFAVQFTRDRNGLVGALRKIGGTPKIARFKNSRAMSVRSFFLSDPEGGDRRGFFSTHPSLASRIRALDPSWDKTFIPIKIDDESRGEAFSLNQNGVSALSGASETSRQSTEWRLMSLPDGWTKALTLALAVKSQARKNPGLAYGELAVGSLKAARTVLDAWPQAIRSALEDPRYTEPLLYAVFLSDQEAEREKQLDRIQSNASSELAAKTAELKKLISHPLKIPVLKLLNPAVRNMDRILKNRVEKTVAEIVGLGPKEDFLSAAGEVLLNKALGPAMGGDRLDGVNLPVKVNYNDYAVQLLYHLAHIGAESLPEAESAFRAGRVHLAFPASEGFAPKPRLTPEEFSTTLKNLSEAPEAVKKGLIDASLASSLNDRQITIEEYDFLSALAACLDIPLPWPSALKRN